MLSQYYAMVKNLLGRTNVIGKSGREYFFLFFSFAMLIATYPPDIPVLYT